MLVIIIKNTRSNIEGEISDIWTEKKAFNDELRKVLSYEIPNVEFSPKYKEGFWDGLITLYDWKTKSFPTGCLHRIITFLKEKNITYKIVDERIKPQQKTNLKTTFSKYDKELYFYQKSAVDRAYKVGRGILALPTGSGKTLVSCELISKINSMPILFYVPSISLLRQTYKEFMKYLEISGHPPHIGFIGAGICDVNLKGINIVTYQSALAAFNEVYRESKNIIENDELAGEKNRKTFDTLKEEHEKAKINYRKGLKSAELKFKHLDIENKEKNYKRNVSKEVSEIKKIYDKAKNALEVRIHSLENKKEVRNLIVNAKGFMTDECHVASVIIEALGNHAVNAYWRYGCSGTPFREDNQEIRIEGTMGRKLFEISCSDLIDLKFLVPPKIYMLKIDHIEKTTDYRDTYHKHIINCFERNYRIKQCAEEFKAIGKPVLILVEQIEHGRLLEQLIKDSVFVAGSDKGDDDPDSAERDYRRRMLNEVEANNIILIATQWAYVGIDAPAISTLILAGSSQSAISVYQMVGRALRKSPGKEEAIIIDFYDRNDNLRNHSNYRKKIYQRERSWEFKLIK
jgi:superfamily II DNA or RNA helicase